MILVFTSMKAIPTTAVVPMLPFHDVTHEI